MKCNDITYYYLLCKIRWNKIVLNKIHFIPYSYPLHLGQREKLAGSSRYKDKQTAIAATYMYL